MTTENDLPVSGQEFQGQPIRGEGKEAQDPRVAEYNRAVSAMLDGARQVGVDEGIESLTKLFEEDYYYRNLAELSREERDGLKQKYFDAIRDSKTNWIREMRNNLTVSSVEQIARVHQFLQGREREMRCYFDPKDLRIKDPTTNDEYLPSRVPGLTVRVEYRPKPGNEEVAEAVPMLVGNNFVPGRVQAVLTSLGTATADKK